jgi:hypothetical protein
MNALKCKHEKQCRDAYSRRCDDCQHNDTPSFYQRKPLDLPPDSPPKIEMRREKPATTAPPPLRYDPRLDHLYVTHGFYYLSLLWHKLTGKWLRGDDLHQLKRDNQLSFMA